MNGEALNVGAPPSHESIAEDGAREGCSSYSGLYCGRNKRGGCYYSTARSHAISALSGANGGRAVPRNGL